MDRLATIGVNIPTMSAFEIQKASSSANVVKSLATFPITKNDVAFLGVRVVTNDDRMIDLLFDTSIAELLTMQIEKATAGTVS